MTAHPTLATSDALPSDSARRDEEDAATVLAVLAAVAAGSAVPPAPAAGLREFWGDPGHRLGIVGPGRHGWWISGQPR